MLLTASCETKMLIRNFCTSALSSRRKRSVESKVIYRTSHPKSASSIAVHVVVVLLLLVTCMTVTVTSDPASSERSSSRKSHSRSSSSSGSSSSSSSSNSLSSSSSQLNPLLPPSGGLSPPSFPSPNGSPTSSSTAVSSSSSPAGGSKMECTYALGKCTRRMTCGIALHDYRISCKQELYGVSQNCSELCQLSIISLASTPEGYDYLHCDCAQNDYCKLIRQRTEPCHPKKNNKPEYDLCRGAELVCRADTVCNTSFDYYRRHCNDLIRGKTRECSRRCNNTVSLLWRQKAGHSLKNCTCEKGAVKCRREREAVMRSCLGLEGFKAGYTSFAFTTSSQHLFNFIVISTTILVHSSWETLHSKYPIS